MMMVTQVGNGQYWPNELGEVLGITKKEGN